MKVEHYRYATLPYRNTLACTCCQLSLRGTNMFLYGRGARERSEFYELKARYFTLKFHPQYLITLVTCHDRSPFKNIWQRVLGSNQ